MSPTLGNLSLGLDSLDQLILNHNQISHLEANGFSGLPKLTTLYIDHNGVETINKEAFKGLEGINIKWH